MITIAHCLQIGGHCFPKTPVGQVPGTSIFLFQCTHCGFPQSKLFREAWVPIISGEIESKHEEDTEEHLGGV